MALTVGVFGSTAGLAGGDASSNVLVTATVYSGSGTSQDSVTLAGLQADPGQCPTYQGQSMDELGRQGWVDVPLPPNNTWTLPTILGCLQPQSVPLSDVTGITVIDSNGAPEEGADSQLTPQDLNTNPPGSDFNKPSEYPVVEALGSFNQYDRPYRGSPQGQPDYDFLDEVQATQDDQPTPIAIDVFEGPHLTVTINASRTTVPVGGSVSFSANVTGPDDTGLSYSWDFDGGAPSSTASAPEVTFNAAGQYEVTLQVTDSAGGGGGAEVPITVGTPAPTATGGHSQTGAGTSRKSHTPTGPRKSSGHHPGAAPGKHNGQTGSSGRTPSSAPAKTPTTPAAATPTTPAATTPHTASTPPRSPATPAPIVPTPAPALRPPRPRLPLLKPPPPQLTEGSIVTGQLISDVTPLAPAVSPLVHILPAPAASAPPARQALRASLLPGLATAAAIALLLGLGAGRELRWWRAWRGWRGWQALRPGG